MRRLVNGEEVELADEPPSFSRLPDRLVVHTLDGSYSALAVRQGDAVLVSYGGRQYRVEPVARKRSGKATASSGEIKAPLPGVVTKVSVKIAEKIGKGHLVVVLEAMKTQQPLVAPFDAVVEKLFVEPGQNVAEGQLLALLKKSTEDD